MPVAGKEVEEKMGPKLEISPRLMGISEERSERKMDLPVESWPVTMRWAAGRGGGMKDMVFVLWDL